MQIQNTVNHEEYVPCYRNFVVGSTKLIVSLVVTQNKMNEKKQEA